MQPQTEKKIILVVRNTRLDELIARFNTEAQARFYVEHLGADFADYKLEDSRYKSAVRQARQQLDTLGRVQVLDRSFIPNYLFGPDDTVVVLGQDGLVANTLKYLNEQPVVGINPDPSRWEGVLLPFEVADLPKIFPDVLAGRRRISEVTMAKAELNDGQVLYAVNDLFIGAKSHISARYRISSGSVAEQHSSSGIIVSTGLGSTGWFKSLMAGAAAIASALSGRNVETAPAFPWDADYLYFTVREPFPSTTSQAGLVIGTVTGGEPLTIVSLMAESGVVFSDGIESDYLDFNAGTRAVIAPAAKKGKLVV
jgi:NAD kinase